MQNFLYCTPSPFLSVPFRKDMGTTIYFLDSSQAMLAVSGHRDLFSLEITLFIAAAFVLRLTSSKTASLLRPPACGLHSGLKSSPDLLGVANSGTQILPPVRERWPPVTASLGNTCTAVLLPAHVIQPFQLCKRVSQLLLERCAAESWSRGEAALPVSFPSQCPSPSGNGTLRPSCPGA